MPHFPTLLILASAYVVMSSLTFLAHWCDKRAAGRGSRRTPESTLHLLELLGGWPGAILARSRLRHKSRKISYRIILAMIVLLHIAGWIGLWLFWQRTSGS